MLQFFDQDFTPTTCSCGASDTFNVAAAIQFVNEQIGCNYVHAGISGSAIRYYVKDHRIGCVGNQVHFRNSGKQVHAVQVIVKNNSQNLLSANSWATVAQLSADCWPTDGQLSANSLCYD